MSVSNRHLLSQLPTASAMLELAIRGVLGCSKGPLDKAQAKVRELSVERPPLPPALVRDYIEHVGGGADSWRGQLPYHLFPQWVFPLSMRLLAGLGAPLAGALNAGARLEVRAPLPVDEPLIVRAWLSRVDDRDGRAILEVASSTGTPSSPNALGADMTLLLRRGGGGGSKERERPRASMDARELGRLRIPAGAGRDFARLTGDINPVHSVPAYARMMGFANAINHGFSTMARGLEVLIREELDGRPDALDAFACRFTRPLVLPGDVGVYVRDGALSVADAAGEPSYLEGTYEVAS